MSVTAVVVNYRTWSLVRRLAPLLKGDPAVREVIVIDNSPEECAAGKVDLRAFARYVANQDNVGFAAAVNQGVRLASSRYVALINPDVLPAADCLRRLYDTAVTHRAALVGPRFYWDEERTFRLPPATGGCLWWEAAGRWASVHPLDARILRQYWCLRHDAFWAATTPFAEIFLSGALLLIDRDALARADGGILDESFFLYYEDTDLCARAVLSGLPVLCEPRAEAVHYWNQSPVDEGHKRRLMSLSQRVFFEKYYGTSLPELPVLCAPPVDALLPATPPPVDLGLISEPPVFTVPPQGLESPLYLEFGVTSLFVPFAQAPITERVLRLPRPIWDRLAPGMYFCRIRDPLSGDVALWRWTKHDFRSSHEPSPRLRDSRRA